MTLILADTDVLIDSPFFRLAAQAACESAPARYAAFGPPEISVTPSQIGVQRCER